MKIYKLGRGPVRRDLKTLLFEKYLTPALPVNPRSYNWGTKISNWGMMRNDTVSCCTMAAGGHFIMEWTAAAGRPFVPSDNDIIKSYSDVTGYDPKTGANDNGAAALDVLKYWRNTGIAGHKIGAFASIPPSKSELIKSAIFLFGGAYLGVSLPLTAQEEDKWDVESTYGDGEKGSWGGHAVPAIAFDSNGVTVITWGKPLKMSWPFFVSYVEESYAILSPDFVTGNMAAPNGVDGIALQNDLAAL